MDKHIHTVVIIGAGIAGLTTAHELSEQGITDVLILEAQDYIGGRIKTSMVYGEPVELGAEFVHGKHVATWKYIDEFTLSVITVGGQPKLVDIAGAPITDGEYQQFMNLRKKVASGGRQGISIAELVDELRTNETQRVVDLVNDSLGDYEAANAEELDSGAFTTMKQLTAHNGANHVLPNGYRQLIDYLAQGQKINSGCVVKQIHYINPSIVVITLEDGQIIYCKKVVVTVSIGILQHRDITFLPELSREKQLVIKRLGMGNVVKVILHFKTAKLVENFFHVADGENESLQTVSCWWQSASNHKVLVGYAGGVRHDAITNMNQEELQLHILADLQHIVGRDVSDELVSIEVVRWDTNTFTRGAYSNHPVGVSNNERAILAKPIGNQLFFAGEATVTSGNYATVHGAIESGQRTAQQISEQMKGKSI